MFWPITCDESSTFSGLKNSKDRSEYLLFKATWPFFCGQIEQAFRPFGPSGSISGSGQSRFVQQRVKHAPNRAIIESSIAFPHNLSRVLTRIFSNEVISIPFLFRLLAFGGTDKSAEILRPYQFSYRFFLECLLSGSFLYFHGTEAVIKPSFPVAVSLAVQAIHPANNRVHSIAPKPLRFDLEHEVHITRLLVNGSGDAGVR